MTEVLQTALKVGDSVQHARHGHGTVRSVEDDLILVRFDHGVEEVLQAELTKLRRVEEVMRLGHWDKPLDVMVRCQGAAIRSVHDAWGVFSRSRIRLLPHQLWVCHQVNEHWPTRWLVADDVGLGKTVEAGLILSPLISRGTVRRLLIICPASLVQQWQKRMYEMFDIRLNPYESDRDTDKNPFWRYSPFVVASLQTLRITTGQRRERLLEADPWDMVMIDEAHHLNADAQSGFTQSYELVKELEKRQRIRSMILLTGTPHRGKHFGFLSLLSLLDSNTFDNTKPLESFLPALPRFMLRNNKYSVTDLAGNKLFQKPVVSAETYHYSPEEEHFYRLMTRFVSSGQAYASELSFQERRLVMLVLIALQKLASSSVAAVRRALQRRLQRLTEAATQLDRHTRKSSSPTNRSSLEDARAPEMEPDEDRRAELEEALPDSIQLQLMRDEIQNLHELLRAADGVTEETRICRILSLVKERFAGRNILLFTEYKATQSLLYSALIQDFGEESVVFINGEERLLEVKDTRGRARDLHLSREDAVKRFSEGPARFLISTEAGGEGIDLQARCFTLIHVDLPWNPMRLHQRVGRLNRLGQTHPVEVISLRNPDTVESLIWERLNEKLDKINQTLGAAMEEPEDMSQLVLGMSSPSVFQTLFSEAHQVPREALSRWFDQQTSSLGGRDVIKVVQELVGHCARFEFGHTSTQLPQVDLPDLKVFLEASLALQGRRLIETGDGFSFLTPQTWRRVPAMQSEYKLMRLDRQTPAPSVSDKQEERQKRLLGMGHVVMDMAVADALARDALLAALPADELKEHLLVYGLRDKVTGRGAGERSMVIAVSYDPETRELKLLKDWQLLLRLNRLSWRRPLMQQTRGGSPSLNLSVTLQAGLSYLRSRLESIEHGFQRPELNLLAALIGGQSTELGGAEPREE